eukprot:gnl/TRDRNA2_/TRDRNA2_175000_c13_seq3.p1 gnl/TRDRNA2_/TRDRNA2_175000_c13~~gnl/TRDRNA2_/TRDRNA2_175000_c13_seq3.p1  ORF type:complete len:727 (+),score=233.25 gnl/TRDRNA2_/TRDRNA2_175000_c13_seq3:44-2182(+)
MAVQVFVLFAIAAFTTPSADAGRLRGKGRETPIRKVVNMMQAMQVKVGEEQVKEEKLFDKFMCYCKTNQGKLSASIAAANDKIPQLEAQVKEVEALKGQLESELKKHQEDRANAKQAISEATAMREKEEKEFAASSTDLKNNIAALGKAIPALEKGMGKEMFIQTKVASTIQQLVLAGQPRRTYDREALTEFLQSGEQSGSLSAGSGEIVGILKQMKADMEADLTESTDTENAAIASFESLISAKKKEVAAATAAIEEKTSRLGEVKVQAVSLKYDLKDTEKGLASDQKLLDKLNKDCEQRQKDFAIAKKSFAEELVALADTIKMLNSDETQALFRKTAAARFVQIDGNTALSFIQVNSMSGFPDEAIASLKAVAANKQGSPRVAMLAKRALAAARHAHKSSKGFEKVEKLIDDMITLLGEDQKVDDMKKDHCEKELAKEERNKELTGRDIEAKQSDIDNTQDQIKQVTSEIETLKQGIIDLDKAVAEATEQRKTEHEDHNTFLSDQNAAIEVLGMAKERLNKFYNPGGSASSAASAAAASSAIQTSSSDTAEDFFGPSFVQTNSENNDDSGISAQQQQPAAGQESSGVIMAINQIQADIEKEIVAADMTEKNSQADYEEMMQVSAEKRMNDAQSITEKSGVLAGLEEDLQKHQAKHEELTTMLKDIMQVIANLHAECDFLLQYYDQRKVARAGEAEAMKKAKAVLNGANFS